MRSKLNDFIDQNKILIEKEMSKHLDNLSIPERLKKSMTYSIEAGGKRIRPILLIASYNAYNKNTQRTLSAAIALEMIHTYSLIHDDLPAMDDDDLRRGKPTNHIVFDEATAILAGDALLTYSFELISNDSALNENEKVKMIQLLAQASGPKGMVAGQFLDMEAENNEIAIEQLERIHTLKTGELLRFAIIGGAYLGGATSEQQKHLREFAFYLGLIFQVQDDILDVMGDPELIGKPTGSDEGNMKSTYPKLLGTKGAIDKKDEYVTKAKEALILANANESYLMELTDYFSQRDH
ncbi:polyprenyl synthetase family protein [Virgibacillus byunsanensis]|uniref:Polyprenyl synthetase family protein n=1 Tax=Virgibacillus byunsanensis TaxID=570945 RepID=A0ABW3LM60_9BACI